MIPLLLFGTCGKTVEEPWEVEVYSARVRGPEEAANQAVADEPLVDTLWSDSETELSLHVPEGWLAWPGAPSAEVRLHLEHTLSGTQLRVFHTMTAREWPVSEACAWSFEDLGAYSGLRVSGALAFASCWPNIPGGERRAAWRFEGRGGFWLVEARIPGGRAGLAEEAIEGALPEFQF